MRCPYCRETLQEESPECPGCRLTLERASKLLGALPRIEPGVSDHTDAIDTTEQKRLLRRMEEIGYRFPQIRIQIVFRHFEGDHPLSLFAFWLFNLGGLSSAAEKDSGNHMVLIVVDPLRFESCIMVGYGLEPFVTEQEIDSVLDLAESAWLDKDWSGGTSLILDGLESLLERSALRVAQVLGSSVREASSAPPIE